MPPKREVSDDINVSESLSHVSEGAELLFRQLIHSKHIERGIGSADPEIVKSGCCPRRPKVSLEAIKRRLDELVAEGCVQRFCDEYGRPMIRLTNWERYQKGRGLTRKANQVGPTLFPDPVPNALLLALKDWWNQHPEFGPPEIEYAIETCRDWSRGSNRRRQDWLAVLQNGIRKGWLRRDPQRPRSPRGAAGALALLRGEV